LYFWGNLTVFCLFLFNIISSFFKWQMDIWGAALGISICLISLKEKNLNDVTVMWTVTSIWKGTTLEPFPRKLVSVMLFEAIKWPTHITGSRTHALTHSHTYELTHLRKHTLTHSHTHARTHASHPSAKTICFNCVWSYFAILGTEQNRNLLT